MDLFPAAFETERLRYERLDESMGAFELYEYTSSDEFVEVGRFISKDPHHTPKETADYLAESAERWDEGSRANWAMYPTADEDGAGEFAGVASCIPLWDRRTARLGVWLRTPFWGRGYSGERADALVALTFDRLDLELVGAGCVDGNENSKRAIEKYVERWGGTYEGLLRNWLTLDDEPRDLHRWSISRAEYEESDVTPELTVDE
ncbi:GNAT family N-acetyltransferase [Haloarchaeobius iranensis]|uniref:Protein N-acetyltransferase, RimJ/RimL family n=1 Tax=Haloarchaeobius iranensis TaxID=996166 RepID=A0A1G9YZL8_9EURY|nr:GNAT family protein [Haloarchaeobius iranensis]SDN14578.1 Protein N-acetyltransferase, RimJ/RimL family [Haloarchaeobius iranensis]